MANEQDRNSTSGQDSDISKSQATQQPTGQQGSQSSAEQLGGQADSEQTGDEAATGQAQGGFSPDEGLQGDTMTQQRSDIEGGSQSGLGGSDQSGGGFVGSQSQQDTSSELVSEEDEDFSRDGQGAPEGK